MTIYAYRGITQNLIPRPESNLIAKMKQITNPLGMQLRREETTKELTFDINGPSVEPEDQVILLEYTEEGRAVFILIQYVEVEHGKEEDKKD